MPALRTRSGGRASRRAQRAAPNVAMLPGLKNTLPWCEIMDESQVERIDTASMDILENVGVVFRDDIALADWKSAGAKVDGETVYLDRGLVRALIATIPSVSLTTPAIRARTSVWVGATVYSCQ